MIEKLFLLLCGHAIADYPLQSEFIAKHKSHKASSPFVPWFYVLAAHSFTHALAVWLVIGTPYALAELVIHFITDWAKCEGLINIHTDQLIHVSTKVILLGIWRMVQ